MTHNRLRKLVKRVLPVLREDLQTLCECEALGGVEAAHCGGPLRFEPEVVEGVLDLARMILEAEALVGRQPGPDWLDAVIDGRRAVEVVEGAS
jgi:hypothetical protein